MKPTVEKPLNGSVEMLTKEEIIERIEAHRADLVGFGVKCLVLVGSFARGDASEESDIDFLVDFHDNRGLFEDYVRLLHFLEDLFGKRVDLGEERLLRKELKPFILEGPRVEAEI